MKIAIVGSRGYKHISRVVRFVHSLSQDDIVVSGGARGVDQAAEDAANDIGLHTCIFHANWNRYGKSAGFRRNQEIVNYADFVVAFWDGWSKGTAHTIDLAKRSGKKIMICGDDDGDTTPAWSTAED